ncbi:MAG: 2-C-methyl-D-erythritol 2,4-cyclodiphosphate synthase [Acidobacteriota bacterium]
MVDVVIAAAGSGRRLGSRLPKAFLEVAGSTLVAHSLRHVRAVEPRRVLVTVPAEPEGRWKRLLGRLQLGVELRVVTGGESRQASVFSALQALRQCAEESAEPLPDLVLVHDAARPCASAALWQRVKCAAGRCGAAIPVLAAVDCLKRVAADGSVEVTVDRQGLMRAQTPQGFRFDWLWEAHRRAAAARFAAADDAALVERQGHEVGTVEGEATNLKVTTEIDLQVVGPWLARDAGSAAEVGTSEREDVGEGSRLRVGHGYDIHPLVKGRKLVLGGVEIPNERGLAGHSDADALAHAVADALLGAAALGDIGQHFPGDDSRWRDADSMELLQTVKVRVHEAGYRPSSVDATLIAESPALAPHLRRMREQLAASLGLPLTAVSVKATRAEGIGGLGRGEGIAAHAVALLIRA